MGYSIYGFIGKKDVAETISNDFEEARTILLNDTLYLIPLTCELCDAINQLQESDKIGRFVYLNDRINNLLKELSYIGMIGYIEADYFGGNGGQGSIVWDNGAMRVFCDFDFNNKFIAINGALACFGIIKTDLDEFDTVGLGRNRTIDDWLEE